MKLGAGNNLSPTGWWSIIERTRPEVNKLLFMLNSAENEICSAYKELKYQQLKLSSCTAELSMRFFLLINIKMPTVVGILIFISRRNFMLNRVEYETKFHDLEAKPTKAVLMLRKFMAS